MTEKNPEVKLRNSPKISRLYMGFTNVESTHCPKYFGAPAERQSAAGTSQIMREVIRFLLDCGGQVFVVPWFQWIVSPCVFFFGCFLHHDQKKFANRSPVIFFLKAEAAINSCQVCRSQIDLEHMRKLLKIGRSEEAVGKRKKLQRTLKLGPWEWQFFRHGSFWL